MAQKLIHIASACRKMISLIFPGTDALLSFYREAIAALHSSCRQAPALDVESAVTSDF